jgi:transposase
MPVDVALARKLAAILPQLNEKQRRLLLAAEARAFGRGGITRVALASGVSPPTIRKALRELAGPADLRERIRRPGAGRKRTEELDPTVREDLERLIDPVTRGDPMSPRRWTCKSLRKLTAELQAQGHRVSRQLVGELLHDLGYSLQANRKTLEGSAHPDRDAQFAYVNAQVQTEIEAGEPAISVDTKKKELVGPFKNAGQEWQPHGQPEAVRVHDFIDRDLGRASPYGVYDLAGNVGWVNVGIDHDTATFAVESIRRWWTQLGRATYPHATRLLITADGGGSNGSRVRLWKLELQQLADETGLVIHVCHFPPGTSKWNKIEHRLFAFISQNWRGKPLVTYETIVSLIGGTSTRTGLQVHCQLDANAYPVGRKVTDEELATVRLERDDFHGDWNYRIHPTPSLANVIS